MVGERRHRRFGSSSQTLDRNPPALYHADRNRPGYAAIRSRCDDRAGRYRPLSEEKAERRNYETKPDPGFPNMTSLRQIESNRRNALGSTGPKTKTGKQRSSQNAIRHGLTAETVIGPLEDPEDYKAFEQAVTADYDAETAVERELVLRLASLVGRWGRSPMIDTGLLRTEVEVRRERRPPPAPRPAEDPAIGTARRSPRR